MASKICSMASKIWNGNQDGNQILTRSFIMIEILMWLGWMTYIYFGRDENGERLHFLCNPITYYPYLLSSLAMMSMELYGTVKKHRNTMIAAIATRYIRVLYFIIITYLHFIHLFNDLPLQVYEMVESPFGITLFIWDFVKIVLDRYLIPPSKYNQYENV